MTPFQPLKGGGTEDRQYHADDQTSIIIGSSQLP
jgi:hypothetical protein